MPTMADTKKLQNIEIYHTKFIDLYLAYLILFKKIVKRILIIKKIAVSLYR